MTMTKNKIGSLERFGIVNLYRGAPEMVLARLERMRVLLALPAGLSARKPANIANIATHSPAGDEPANTSMATQTLEVSWPRHRLARAVRILVYGRTL
jgi:hypothetical protein